jgi:hypothetical protein
MISKPNKKLKLILFERNISQRQLAFGSDVHETDISKAVKHGIISKEAKCKISDYLQIEPEECF